MTSSAPPRPPLLSVIVASLAVSIPLGIMALLATSTTSALFIPPIGAATALIIGAPNLPLSQPRNVVIGHATGAIVGVSMSNVWQSSVLAASVAAGLTFGITLYLRSAHSPAVATAMVATLFPTDNDAYFIFFVTLSACLVVLLAMIVNKLRKVQYPQYWW